MPYTLYDMAGDAIGLLDALGIERAHFVGRSMGGMIAQIAAGQYPERVMSLTSIMSGTGNPALPSASQEVMAILTQRAPNPREDEAGFLAHSLAFARLIASPGYPFDEKAHRAIILNEINRSYDPGGFGRQIAAIAAIGDLRPLLAAVAYLDSTTRTVVIRNPGKGESTAFRPDYDIGWDNYIKRLPTQKIPPMN
ncbi:alpha/beta fold hydrolase [Morganella psychrotolerans]|uniref:alpha/beta fold hydrolase n=1 Tax=Morganella psychrotolerans TaxID=368603 RepID=UPI0039AF2439